MTESNGRLPKDIHSGTNSGWTPERVAAVVGIVSLIALGSVLFGVFAASFNFYWIAICIVGTLLIGLVAWQFEAAMVVYALVAFVPWGRTPDLAVGGSGSGKGVYISEVMLGFLLTVWAVRSLLKLIPQKRIGSGFYRPLALYLAYSVLCVVNGFIFWDPHIDKLNQHPSVNVIELGLRFLSAGALVMMATSISSTKWVKLISFSLMIPGIYSLLNALAGGAVPVTGIWWSLLGFLPACFMWGLVLEPGTAKHIRIIGVAGTAIALFITFFKSISWVSGWLGLLTALAAVTYVRNRKLFAILVFIFVCLMAFGQPFIKHNIIADSKESGDYDRFSLMQGSLKYATTFPLGVGPGNYRAYNSFYYGKKWGTTSYTSAHGTYSQHLSEMGFPGTIILLSLLFLGGKWLLSRHRRLPPGLSRMFLLAAFGQTVGITCASILGDYIIPTYHNGGLVTFSTTVYTWLVWGAAIAHVRLSGVDAAAE